MKTTKNPYSDKFASSSKKSTTSHWEEFETSGYLEAGKASYKKHFSAKREVQKMWKDSYCGEKWHLVSIHLLAAGASWQDVYILLTESPFSYMIKLICAHRKLDYIEVVKTLRRL